jgi:SAM-dependent methyltransferase
MTEPKDIYGQASPSEGFWADEGTSAYYAKNSKELTGRYESGPSPLDIVERYLPAEGRALDVGCGTGRDVCRLEKLGLDSFGTEPSGEMREQARSLHPELKGRLFSAGLPGLEGCGDSYDLITCSAVLQHLPASMLFDSIFTMKHLLKTEGLLILSVPLRYPGVDEDTSRDQTGRLFFLRPIEEYLFLAERIGFTPVERVESDDALNRKGFVWEHLILRADAGDGQRPIERIESILRNDRKTNSNKFQQ